MRHEIIPARLAASCGKRDNKDAKLLHTTLMQSPISAPHQ
jgi:hypothetical protein